MNAEDNTWKVTNSKKGAVEADGKIDSYGVILKEPSLEVSSVSEASLYI